MICNVTHQGLSLLTPAKSSKTGSLCKKGRVLSGFNCEVSHKSLSKDIQARVSMRMHDTMNGLLT